MDFFRVKTSNNKKEGYSVRPAFQVKKSSDFMIRGGKFYAIWDESRKVWSTDEYMVRVLVDDELYKAANNLKAETGQEVNVASMMDYEGKPWKMYKSYVSMLPDSYHVLDENIKFSNDEIHREDYCSFVLSYPLVEAPCPNYDLLMSTLYDEEEREKLEWAIGAIISGDSKHIQKFVVLYGDAGSGKSTFLTIVQKLFGKYCQGFEAKELGISNRQFSMEAFRSNPLVGVQHDGDLSRIEDNTRLNSIISHETMLMHEKFKSSYEIKLNTFLFMGTNQPVKISDAKSGIIRRLIDVHPSGRKLKSKEYNSAFSKVDFELSGIAWRCLQVYKELGEDYYSNYIPISMMYQTDHFFNFMEEYYYDFAKEPYITLNRIWELYKNYCDNSLIQYRYTKTKVREELKTYFERYEERPWIDGSQKRNVYFELKKYKIHPELKEAYESPNQEEEMMQLELYSTISDLDEMLADCPAQYATEDDKPIRKWDEVTTTLKDLDTKRVHYVRPPENHIVIDFDLKDPDGNKCAELNLKAAAKWPLTYAEFSKGGNGIHLHYIYDGDVKQLSALYSPGIEVKVFSGKSSLRRRLSYCNDLPVAHLSSGLPLKEVKNVVNFTKITSEIGLRELINRNLNKQIVPATKPSVDFIYKDLEKAYASGLEYDVRDMRPKILAFANNSSNQSDYCVKLVAKMKFCSEEKDRDPDKYEENAPLVFYDIEVFPNLLLVCWKQQGPGHEVVRMFNPSSSDIEKLFKMKLVGFNSSRYDAHILYARYLGYDNQRMYDLSQKIVTGPKEESRNALFREAYSVDYVDVYDYAAKKQSLKKWEIELGIHHQENSYPWDQPLPEEHWNEVADYCCNDVIATEEVFNHTKGDFIAREILAELAGMPVGTSTNKLTERIIFGGDRNPKLIYTHLDTGEQE